MDASGSRRLGRDVVETGSEVQRQGVTLKVMSWSAARSTWGGRMDKFSGHRMSGKWAEPDDTQGLIGLDDGDWVAGSL